MTTLDALVTVGELVDQARELAADELDILIKDLQTIQTTRRVTGQRSRVEHFTGDQFGDDA